MLSIFRNFVRDETGATAIEYALIGVLISVSLIAGATTLGEQLNEQFQDVANKLKDSQNARNP